MEMASPSTLPSGLPDFSMVAIGVARKNMSASMSACCTFWISSCVMSVSVEGVSALVAEFVDVRVFDVFLVAVGALVYLVHAGKIDHLCVSTIGAVVRGEELVEALDGVVHSGVEVGLFVNPAEDADSEVTLEVFVVHIKSFCG